MATSGHMLSIFGFWMALVLIGVSALTAIHSSCRRDRNGLITASVGVGIGVSIAGPIVASFVIATTSLGIFGTPSRDRWVSDLLPTLAQYAADTPVANWAVTGVILLWWYAFLSVTVAGVIRYRRQRAHIARNHAAVR
jgi:hypothetical protein